MTEAVRTVLMNDDRDDQGCRGSDAEAHVGKVNSQQQKHSKQSRLRIGSTRPIPMNATTQAKATA
ncbi:hypothetical protein [Brevibacillus centrosporus]|uniref:hypothetical protein n=1 Tax=Brevibacillus centrosporus TaxID=54910 RepID=UPI000B846EB6